MHDNNTNYYNHNNVLTLNAVIIDTYAEDILNV